MLHLYETVKSSRDKSSSSDSFDGDVHPEFTLENDELYSPETSRSNENESPDNRQPIPVKRAELSTGKYLISLNQKN